MTIVPLPRPRSRRPGIDFKNVIYPAAGLTKRQVDLAVGTACETRDDNGMFRSWDRVIDALIELEEAIEEARVRTLSVMVRSHPAAAVRIMQGKKRR